MTTPRGRIRCGLPDLVGRTPLVRLDRLVPDGPSVFAKLEGSNPGGSAKDRPALAMLQAALADGSVTPGSTVVESSSGNLGVALAQQCHWHGLRFVCVVDPRTNTQTVRLMRAHGAEVHRVETPDPATGDWLPARRRAVELILAATPGAWTSDQYGNRHNPAAHAAGTMREVVDDLGRAPDAVLVATSTTGTLQGCSAHVHALEADTTMIAVDAQGSALFGGTAGPRRLPGFGASTVPELARTAEADVVVRVDDLDCVVGCRRLAHAESLLVGASGGAVVTALGRELQRFGPQDDVVLIVHDAGERYLETVYDDAWVESVLHCSPRDLERLVHDRVLPA